jgi:hypothetical protein
VRSPETRQIPATELRPGRSGAGEAVAAAASTRLSAAAVATIAAFTSSRPARATSCDEQGLSRLRAPAAHHRWPLTAVRQHSGSPSSRHLGRRPGAKTRGRLRDAGEPTPRSPRAARADRRGATGAPFLDRLGDRPKRAVASARWATLAR